jgi:hypothetical protein
MHFDAFIFAVKTSKLFFRRVAFAKDLFSARGVGTKSSFTSDLEDTGCESTVDVWITLSIASSRALNI